MDSPDISVKGTPPSHLGNRLRHIPTFEVSANVGYFGVKERALLMSSKGRNVSRDDIIKFVVAVCLLKFACYFVNFYVLGL